MITAKPVAAIAGIYKLVEDCGGARMKLSPGKQSRPGRKQVFRQTGVNGTYLGDIIALHDEQVPGTPLLTLAVRGGRRVRPKPALEQIRNYCLGAIARLPERIKGAGMPAVYPCKIAPELKALIGALTKNGGQST